MTSRPATVTIPVPSSRATAAGPAREPIVVSRIILVGGSAGSHVELASRAATTPGRRRRAGRRDGEGGGGCAESAPVERRRVRMFHRVSTGHHAVINKVVFAGTAVGTGQHHFTLRRFRPTRVVHAPLTRAVGCSVVRAAAPAASLTIAAPRAGCDGAIPSKMASRPARRADKCDGAVARFVIGVDGATDEALRVCAVSRRVSMFSAKNTRLGEVRFFVVASGGRSCTVIDDPTLNSLLELFFIFVEHEPLTGSAPELVAFVPARVVVVRVVVIVRVIRHGHLLSKDSHRVVTVECRGGVLACFLRLLRHELLSLSGSHRQGEKIFSVALPVL